MDLTTPTSSPPPSLTQRLDDGQTTKQTRKYRAFCIFQATAFIWLNLEFGNIIQIQFPSPNSNHVIVQSKQGSLPPSLLVADSDSGKMIAVKATLSSWLF